MADLGEHEHRQIEMHRSVAEMYKRRAGYAFADEFQRERNDLLLNLVPPRVPRTTNVGLDLGCGTGLMLNHLTRRCGKVVGIDLSQEMLEGFTPPQGGLAPDTEVWLTRGDMAHLPFASERFDVVLCRSALHHMDDEVAVLAEVCRVLKKGGRLVLGEPANDFPLFRLARWIVRHRPSFGKIHTIDRAYTRGQLRQLLDAAGLEVEREVRFGFVGYPLCDNPDLVPVLKKLPSGMALWISRVLRAVDRGLARIPVIKNWSWYTLLEVRRKA